MATQVILLQRVEKLGNMGDIVNVKPGYARNFLLPQNKALRATESNIAYFEKQKSVLQKADNEKKAQAEAQAKSLKGLTVALIRQAGEAGQLYGSVTARDIAEAINKAADQKVERNTIDLNQNFKEIGLFPVTITLHPEVKIDVTINIARTEDEAKDQLKSGKAAVKSDNQASNQAANDSKAALMEEGAYSAEQKEEAEEAALAAQEAEEKAKKAEAKKAKKAKKADDEVADAPEADADAE